MFLHPLGLLALAAVPIIAALHLFRRRFRPRPVSALFLWSLEDRTPLAGRTRERLLRSPSLWLELLAALALVLALAGPRTGCAGGSASHLVLVLDSSASMGALSSDGSARERALAEARERIDGLARESRVTLIESGPRASVLAGPAAFPAEALAPLENWRPRAARHDLAPAVGLGLRLSGGAAVVLVTDEYEPEAWPKEVELVAVGLPEANLAITHATRTRSEAQPGSEDRVFLTVTSYARSRRSTELVLSAGGQALESRSVELEPAERAHFAFDVPRDAPVIEARLGADALALDDRALLAPVPPRTLALATTLGPASVARLGLSGPSGPIERWLALVPESLDAGDPATAHLVIGAEPGPGPGTWALVIGTAGDGRRDLIGPFLLEKRHPLLAGLTLEGVVWSIDPDLALVDAPLVSAGNQPILTERRESGRRVLTLNLDPARSSLARSPDWPILLANLAELRRAELPGPELTNLTAGQALVYRAGEELGSPAAQAGAGLVLEGPLAADGSRSSATERRELPLRARTVIEGLSEPGLYRLTFDGRSRALVALSFADADESDLRGLQSGLRPSSASRSGVEAPFSWLELALVAGALLALLADWGVLARARRVLVASLGDAP